MFNPFSESEVATGDGADADRTGLPDPVIIDHEIATRAGKIVSLTCRLAGDAV